MFRRLTVLSRDGQLARRRLARDNLYDAGERTDIDTVLDMFIAKRLISLNESGVDIAHDALLGAWPRLRGWLDGDVADLVLFSQVADDAAGWAANGHDASFLYRNAQLTAATEGATRWRAASDRFPPLPPTAIEFLDTSKHRHRQRVAASRGVLAVIVVLLVVAGSAAVVLQQRTDALGRQLRANAAMLLTAQVPERNRSDPAIAALMAVAAYRSSPDPAVLTNLSDEYMRYRSTDRLHTADAGQLEDVHVSADGRVVAALGAQGRIALWRLDRQPVVPTYLGQGGLTYSALSPDGALIAGADKAGRIEVWRTDGTSVFRQEAGGPLALFQTGLRFDSAGRRLLAHLDRGGPRVWDIEQRRSVPVPPGLVRQFDQYGNDVWFGPRGESIVVATSGGLTLWHLSTGTPVWVSAVDDQDSVWVGGDGLTAIICIDGVHTRWDLDPVRVRGRYPMRGARCVHGLEADPTGSIAITGEDSEVDRDSPGRNYPRTVITLRNLPGGLTSRTVVPTSGTLLKVKRLATLPDGTRMVVAVGAAVAIVDIPAVGFTRLNTAMIDTFSGPMVISGDGTRVVLSAHTGEPWLSFWDIGSDRELARSTDADRLLLGSLSKDRLLLALDAQWEHLVVRQMREASLTVTARLPLPVAPGIKRPTHELSRAFGGLCIDADESTPDMVNVVFGRLITRFDVRSGTQVGEPIRPWHTSQEFDRLARNNGLCAIRPGTDAMAIEVEKQFVETWDLRSGKRLGTLDPTDLGTLADIAFSPDGRLLAVLDTEGMLQIWDMARSTPIAAPQRVSEPGGILRIVAFPEPDRIIVKADTRNVVWDLARRDAIADLDTTAGAEVGKGSTGSTLSPDGNTLHIIGDDLISHIPLDPQDWAARLCQVVGRDMTDAERQALPPGSPIGSICPQ